MKYSSMRLVELKIKYQRWISKFRVKTLIKNINEKYISNHQKRISDPSQEEIFCHSHAFSTNSDDRFWSFNRFYV